MTEATGIDMSQFALSGVDIRRRYEETRKPLDPAHVGAVKRVVTEGGRVGRIAVVRLTPGFIGKGDGAGATAEDQVSRGGAGEEPILPDGYSVGSWDQGLVGPGLWVAETIVATPEGGIQRTVFSSAGGLQTEPLNP